MTMTYRTAYTVGPKWGFFGVLFFVLSLVFGMQPTTRATGVLTKHEDMHHVIPYLPPGAPFGNYTVVNIV